MKTSKKKKAKLYFGKVIPGLLLAADVLDIKLLDGTKANAVRKEAAIRLRELANVYKELK